MDRCARSLIGVVAAVLLLISSTAVSAPPVPAPPSAERLLADVKVFGAKWPAH